MATVASSDARGRVSGNRTRRRAAPVVDAHKARIYANAKRLVVSHMAKVRQLAKLQVYDRLFALWHVVHRPCFYLLALSLVVHVLAVHLY